MRIARKHRHLIEVLDGECDLLGEIRPSYYGHGPLVFAPEPGCHCGAPHPLDPAQLRWLADRIDEMELERDHEQSL